MIDDTIAEVMIERTAQVAVEANDRRRPGRPANVSPTLVGLLRGNFTANTQPSEGAQADSPLSAARGLMFGTMLGLLIWVGAFYLVEGILN